MCCCAQVALDNVHVISAPACTVWAWYSTAQHGTAAAWHSTATAWHGNGNSTARQRHSTARHGTAQHDMAQNGNGNSNSNGNGNGNGNGKRLCVYTLSGCVCTTGLSVHPSKNGARV